MGKQFEVTWTDEVGAPPEAVWDAVTRHSDGWLWPIAYEPRVGGAETGLSGVGGLVTVWEPPARFVTRAEQPEGPNQLTYALTAIDDGTRTHVDYHHLGSVPVDEYDIQVEACRVHTDLYRHSMGQYATHFAGCDATYVEFEAGPSSCAEGSTARLVEALGLAEAVVGDAVTLAVTGAPPIEAVVDYRQGTFVGLRSAHGLHRIYGRDRWGWPVSVAHHLFGPVDRAAVEAAWSGFVAGVYERETV